MNTAKAAICLFRENSYSISRASSRLSIFHTPSCGPPSNEFSTSITFSICPDKRSLLTGKTSPKATSLLGTQNLSRTFPHSRSELRRWRWKQSDFANWILCTSAKCEHFLEQVWHLPLIRAKTRECTELHTSGLSSNCVQQNTATPYWR